MTVANGTTLNVGSNPPSLGILTLDGGTIQNGSITAEAYCLESGTVSASLAGDGGVTVAPKGGRRARGCARGGIRLRPAREKEVVWSAA